MSHANKIMRIAYIVHWDISVVDGVTRKIAEQMRSWMRAGHTVRLFLLHPAPRVNSELSDLDIHTITASRLDRLRHPRRIADQITDFAPDAIYHRFVTYYPYLTLLAARHPLVLELNTLDRAEYTVAHGLAARTWHQLTRSRLLRACSGMICLTGEIEQSMKRYRRPATVISNGIDLAQVAELPVTTTSSPRLVHIATPQTWHGVDKIAHIARRFKNWQFDLIGYNNADVGDDIPANMHCHGFLAPTEYQALLEQADVAIAPLALHRKKMEEACSLKLREYLARGLPAIIGGRDCDFPDPVPFLLQLPNKQQNVETNFDAIERFVSSWRGRRVERSVIEHLDHGPKEQQRLDFLADAVNLNRR